MEFNSKFLYFVFAVVFKICFACAHALKLKTCWLAYMGWNWCDTYIGPLKENCAKRD